MTYQQRSNTISLMCSTLLLGFYAINVLQLNEAGRFTSLAVFSLWATTIVLAIIITIVAQILITIIFAIVYAIRTKEEESFIEDERDKLIDLQGTRNAYVALGLGVFLSTGSLVLNHPPLVMFNLLVFSAFAAEIFGDLSRLYLYRRAG